MKKQILTLLIIAAVVIFGLYFLHKAQKNLLYTPPPPEISLSPLAAESELTLPFYTRPESEFIITKTYYVAINQPRASNSNNGLYPTYRGGKDGPFKDFSDNVVRSILLNPNEGVKVIVRQGTYKLVSDAPTETSGGSGLVLSGAGDEFHPLILTGYPGETAILDGGEKLPTERLRQIVANKENYHIKIRQAVQLEGQYNIIENLTIRDAWRHNIGIGGKYSIIRNNKLEGVYEDSIKTVAGADYGFIYNNEITGWGSQAIDHFGAHNWIFKQNNIHHPGLDPVSGIMEANGIGGKGGTQNTLIVDNFIHDINTNFNNAAIVGGGTGNIDLFRRDEAGNIAPSASNVIVARNKIYNYRGPAAGIGSCHNCVFENNIIYNTLGGFNIGITADILENESDARAIPKANNTIIRNNIFAGNNRRDNCEQKQLIVLGNICYAHYINNADFTEGFVSEGNIYYTDTAPVFVYTDNNRETKLLNHQQFKDITKTDHSSIIRPLREFKP